MSSTPWHQHASLVEASNTADACKTRESCRITDLAEIESQIKLVLRQIFLIEVHKQRVHAAHIHSLGELGCIVSLKILKILNSRIVHFLGQRA